MRTDAAANRRRVLAAAEEVFGERGMDASTEEIARRAGVGIGTVFRHFPTKRELVEATLIAHFENLTARAQGLVASGAPGTALTTLLHEMAETGSAKLSLAGYLVADAGFGDAAAAASNDLRAAVGRLLDDAQGAGDVRRDVGVEEIYFLLRGLGQAQLSMPVETRTRRRAVEVVLAGLGVVAVPS